ncbi:V-set domain-containing T-cell activation inhibitor 1-like [Lithobates pipiens]
MHIIIEIVWIYLFAFTGVVPSEENDFSRSSNVSAMDADTKILIGFWFSGQVDEDMVAVSVNSSLYGTAQLPCSFPFIHGSEELVLVWKKEEENNKPYIYSFLKGLEHHLEQDSRYKGRTERSTELSQGDLSLTLRGVTFADEGTYYCQAANTLNKGGKKVDLSIRGLNVHSQVGTLSDVDGKKRLTCITIGMFRNPWIRWYDGKNTTLTKYETHHITDKANGMKKVESVLRYDDKINETYFCQVGEGTLHTTTLIVRSEGHPDSGNHANPKGSHLVVGLTKTLFLAILIGILTRS